MIEAPIATQRNNRIVSVLFAGFVILQCVWVLSLPVFPSQDGPMHKYYVHALSQMMHGSVLYKESYQVRRPLPPYATHYALLLGLSQYLSLDHAESLLVCLILIATAYSFRYCAKALGPSGDVVSLCMLPLLLNWNLFMGFFNYALGVALLFLCAGLWCCFPAASWRQRVGFFAALLMMMLTHPVPLLMLTVFLVFDLSLQVSQTLRITRGQSERRRLLIRQYGWHSTGVLCACICFLYPVLISNVSHVRSNMTDFGLHRGILVASIGLYGLSPFNPSSRAFLINIYRLGLASLLVFGIVLAGRGIIQRLRAATLRRSDTFLFASILLGLALPFLPPAMNNAAFFSQRLMILIWLAALAAWAGCPDPDRKLSKFTPWLASALIIITLLNLQRFIAPVSRDIANIELQSIPAAEEGLILSGPGLFTAEKWGHQLGFSPYAWSGALPVIHSNSVLLNSPFLDMTTMPIEANPKSDQAIGHLDPSFDYLLNANDSLKILPPSLQRSLLQASGYIIIVGPIQDLQLGLEPLSSKAAASAYHCTIHLGCSVCLRADSRSVDQRTDLSSLPSHE